MKLWYIWDCNRLKVSKMTIISENVIKYDENSTTKKKFNPYHARDFFKITIFEECAQGKHPPHLATPLFLFPSLY